METKSVGIGLFVLGGLILFGVGMFLIGDAHQLFTHHVEYYAEFTNLGGITNGATVRVAGMTAGEVVAITVPDSPAARFRVKARIDAKLAGLIRTDSSASIGTEGVVGDTFLMIDPGSAKAPPAPALSTIPSREPLDISSLLTQGNKLLQDVNGALTMVQTKVGVALDTITSTVSNANDLVVGLKEGHGTAGMLLRDDVAANHVRAALENVEQATVHVNDAARQANAMMTDLTATKIPQKAGAILDQFTDSAHQIHQVIADATKPDDQGMDAAANIRTSLTNANLATSNLADATEALKHNFLTRGFFKDRGYYSLADLSPDDYREDRTLAKQTARRVWLEGSDLFQPGIDGDEQLSPKGVALLNTTFTNQADALAENPIVVEGYWNGTDPAARFRCSRQRALIVRQYLQTHFQIDQKNLGAVPMKNAPPTGQKKSTWDGICLVVLRKGA